MSASSLAESGRGRGERAGLTLDQIVAVAGELDPDPISRKAREGTFTILDGFERSLRLMWGPDGVTLIENARELHRQAR